MAIRPPPHGDAGPMHPHDMAHPTPPAPVTPPHPQQIGGAHPPTPTPASPPPPAPPQTVYTVWVQSAGGGMWQPAGNWTDLTLAQGSASTYAENGYQTQVLPQGQLP